MESETIEIADLGTVRVYETGLCVITFKDGSRQLMGVGVLQKLADASRQALAKCLLNKVEDHLCN